MRRSILCLLLALTLTLSGCAAAAAMVLQGICRRCTPIEVQLPGGVLTVCISPDDTVQLTGDAVTVFTGEVTV